LVFVATSLIFLSCSKDVHFSGISENSLNQVKENYLTQDYSKEEISMIIGTPLIQENSGNLWIYRLEKIQGNDAFKKTLYNKTLKLKFENNILRSVEEINLD
jgi:outer membrane protein assembly factor BamE (lipoprotein component of BamABCDE complex)